ncbi:hypothetical protein COLO4_10484 [Corchorus olitorius]|uniref:F-box associated beta-propeller type 3 domain-containing protein n=1 Tax=Corchorus olitorius TaxID=93759 RepID=A0A1R3K8A9_9ROSI|nr:hypothetical protein COLO4_10484 [Corchorus olitorius]
MVAQEKLIMRGEKLHLDILLDICSRLPAKSLTRFSKHEFVELPKGSNYSNFDSRADMVGFGYVPSKDVYKVVRLLYQESEVHGHELFYLVYQLRVEILTISNYGSNNNNIIQSCSSWRVLGEDMCDYLVQGNSVLVNGFIYWKIDENWVRENGVEEIYSFNLEDEKFLVLPFPKFAIEDVSFDLVELRGNLWASVCEFRGNDYVMDMWVLKDLDKFNWVKEYSIDLGYFEKNSVEVIVGFNVINVNPNEELLIKVDGDDPDQAYFNLRTKSFTKMEYRDMSIYVFNPSKHEFVELPGFNLDSRAHMVGFGYVPSKDVYKVVRLFYEFLSDYNHSLIDVGVEILTISNYGSNNNNIIQSCSSWRVLDEEDWCGFVVKGKSVLVNGLIHWKIDDRCHREKGVEDILSFNLEDEKFLVLPFPRFAIEDVYSLQLVELRGNLWGSVSTFRENDYVNMDMWVLKDFDKFDWVKEYSINLEYIQRFCDCTDHVVVQTFNVININQNEELLIKVNGDPFYWPERVNGHPDQAYFNLKTKRFSDMESRDIGFQFCYYTDVVSFY